MKRENIYIAQCLNDEVRYWVKHNLKNYLERKDVVENQSEIEHILDFLNSDQAPKRLRKMSYSEALEGSKRWLKTLVKQGNDLEEVEDIDYDVIIDFNDGMKLIKLKSELSFKREGFLMGHCVASYFNRKDTDIYSLRDSKEMPHCTLELPKNATSFYQCKGKGNGSIHVKYIKYILDTMKHFNIEMRDSEMQNLGYFRPESVTSCELRINWFKKHFSSSPTLTLGNKLYFFVG